MANLLTGKTRIPLLGTVPTVIVAGAIGLPLGVAVLYLVNEPLGLGLTLPEIPFDGNEVAEQFIPSPAEVVIFTINPAQVYPGSRMTVSGSFLDAQGGQTTVDEGFYTILEDGREIKATGSIGQNISTFTTDVPIPHTFRDGAYDIYISDHQLTAAEIASRVRLPVNQPVVNLPPQQRVTGPTPPPPSVYNPAGSIGVH